MLVVYNLAKMFECISIIIYIIMSNWKLEKVTSNC